jgi:hypothetical protein
VKLPHRRQFLHLAAGVASFLAASSIARAQSYPSRPITMIVPFAAGGPVDTLGRIAKNAPRTSVRAPGAIPTLRGPPPRRRAFTQGCSIVRQQVPGNVSLQAILVGRGRASLRWSALAVPE